MPRQVGRARAADSFYAAFPPRRVLLRVLVVRHNAIHAVIRFSAGTFVVRVICSTGVLDGLGDCVIPVIFTLPFLALKTALPEERIYAAGVFPVQHYDTTQEFAAKALADMTKVQMPEQTIASFRTRLDSKGGSMVAVWAEDELTMELFEVQRDFGPEAARQVAYERSQTPKLWRRNETRFGHS